MSDHVASWSSIVMTPACKCSAGIACFAKSSAYCLSCVDERDNYSENIINAMFNFREHKYSEKTLKLH